jgi:hypothetical protein
MRVFRTILRIAGENHEAPISASSFETPLARLLKMTGRRAI